MTFIIKINNEDILYLINFLFILDENYFILDMLLEKNDAVFLLGEVN